MGVESPSCQYCHALLQTQVCPHCLELMFRGSKFCPHCGVGVVAVVSNGRGAKCPGCQMAMLVTTIPSAAGPTDLDVCSGCGGIWISLAAFERICADRETQVAALGLEGVAGAVGVGEAGVQVGERPKRAAYLHCPACDKLMNPKKFAMKSGIVIDVCRGHGVWLDAGEMRRIAEFIRSGGLGRAREAEVEQRMRQQAESDAAQRRGREHRAVSGAGVDTGAGVVVAAQVLGAIFELMS